MAASIESVFSLIQNKFSIESLSENQKKATQALLDNKDSFICTKTGSGKSLSYESVPVVMPEPVCVLVIAPLNSIMDEQKKKLEGFGLRCAVIHSGQEEVDIKQVDYIFTSPEIAVGDTKLRKQFHTTEFQETLKLIVVDEAHTVLQWGHGQDGNTPFREYFSRIEELRSVFLRVPVMALTATASPLKRKLIMRSLCLKDCVTIVDSPDRTNIKISVSKISNISKTKDYFTPLLEGLEEQKTSFPKTIVFCTLISDCSKVYFFFLQRFGRHCNLFNMYHSETKDSVKESIRENMNSDNGSIRVLICTNIAGMGVNFCGVKQIIHFGLPRDMDTFVQQMGRAGRDGSFSEEIIFMKMIGSHLKTVEPFLLNLCKNTVECRHKLICDAYLCKYEQILPKHNCCDVCEKDCNCDCVDCGVKNPLLIDITTLQDVEEPESQMISDITGSEDDEIILRQHLKDLQLTSNDDFDNLFSNLSDSAIDDIVLNAMRITKPSDVFKYTTCWTYPVAVQVCDILNSILKTEFSEEEDDEMIEFE